ncbi:MAG: hypothetical protein RR630_04380 [Coprobacillus sp.]
MKKSSRRIYYIIIAISIFMFIVDFLVLFDYWPVRKELWWVDWVLPITLMIHAIVMLRTKK